MAAAAVAPAAGGGRQGAASGHSVVPIVVSSNALHHLKSSRPLRRDAGAGKRSALWSCFATIPAFEHLDACVQRPPPKRKAADLKAGLRRLYELPAERMKQQREAEEKEVREGVARLAETKAVSPAHAKGNLLYYNSLQAREAYDAKRAKLRAKHEQAPGEEHQAPLRVEERVVGEAVQRLYFTSAAERRARAAQLEARCYGVLEAPKKLTPEEMAKANERQAAAAKAREELLEKLGRKYELKPKRTQLHEPGVARLLERLTVSKAR